jgi:hypothetical protein
MRVRETELVMFIKMGDRVRFKVGETTRRGEVIAIDIVHDINGVVPYVSVEGLDGMTTVLAITNDLIEKGRFVVTFRG